MTYGKKHKIIVRVDDDAGDPNKFSRGHALYGKQGYGNARGIWQTVYLEARGSNYFDAIHFTPDIDNKSVNVKSVSYTHLRAHETPEQLVCRRGG